jgi:predicted transcriptional regulator
MNEYVSARVDDDLRAQVQAVADRTNLSESEVLRRLLRLGLEDVDECGDQVLLGDAAIPR